MKKFFNFLLLSLFIFFIFSFIFLYLFSNSIKAKNIDNNDFGIFLINKGDGIKKISENLLREGYIKNKYSFILYNILTDRNRYLKAGKYSISSSMSVEEISYKFFIGDISKRRITIIEGWKLEDINNYLEKEGICLNNEFIEITKEDFSKEFYFLNDKPKSLSLEGYLFPDTYEISDDLNCREVVYAMLNNFSDKIKEEIREEIDSKNKKLFDIVRVASLIEKEVRSIEDKKIVSGIIWKRLEIGMPLQIDATIAYITKKNTTKISLEELKIDSLYNTYLYKGLPIGPISNPGIDSIIAAIYPEKTDFLFYLSTKEGETIFSKNLEEHNIAKFKYLK